MRQLFLTLFLPVLLSACSQTPPERQILNDAAAALGGSDRVLAVKTLVIEGDGTQYNFGQDVSPEAHGQTHTVRGYRRALDLAGGRVRTEMGSTANFRFIFGQQERRQISGFDGTLAYDMAANGAATRASDQVASERRLELLHHPIMVVRAALDPMARLANPRTEGGESLVDVTTAAGQTVTLAIDSTSKLPTRVTNLGSNGTLGDVIMSTRFADYKDVSGLQLPAKLTSAVDDFVTSEINVTTQTVDGDTGDLAAPAAAASAAPPPAPPAPTLTVEPVGKGLWFLSGATGFITYNSVAIEFDDHVTLLDPNFSEALVRLQVAKARELVPNKPLTTAINTHVHFDHAGGLRAAIAEGLTMLTHQGNVAFIQALAMRPRTIDPDALSRNPRPAMLQGISQDTVLSDSTNSATIIPMPTGHSTTMLMVYFPAQRALFVADLYNAASLGPLHPRAVQLVDEIKKRNLRVDRIMPAHGELSTMAQLEKDAAAWAPVPFP